VFEKGKTMLSTGASMLSDFFHKGVETVQHSGVQDIARQGYEKSKQVLASGAKMGIELADKGVHTLEKVGEKALDFIALDESVRIYQLVFCSFVFCSFFFLFFF
jgi:hypothetical protein